ncbi:helix-hairpin-helix domain-containing protein [Salinibaculum rarum]|uniref:helix-hairpin-helix domain-containing protein n=1 Tax=Salinibaculum rarum TaxID=3058903 RepID=UPI00265E7088|nr:helix-hairpin-helix domain-containing protein [Salinibaculum sp. KK48]
MGLLDKLKSLFGSDQDGHSPARDTEPDVTVEHEPAAESEHAVKGTDTAREQMDGDQESAGKRASTAGESEPTTDEPGDDTVASPADDDSVIDDESATDDAPASPSVEEIKGIGPTYAERLESIGIETVADIAAADPAEVAEAAQAGENRATDWVERAQDF